MVQTFVLIYVLKGAGCTVLINYSVLFSIIPINKRDPWLLYGQYRFMRYLPFYMYLRDRKVDISRI